MYYSGELKKLALTSLKGKWLGALIVVLISSIVGFVVSLIVSAVLLPQMNSAMDLLLQAIASGSAEQIASVGAMLQAISFHPLNGLNFISSIIEMAFVVAMYGFFINVLDNKPNTVNSVAEEFGKTALKSILLNILIAIKIFLWSLLFIIPGLIKGFAYSMAPMAMRDDPKLSASQAIKRSCEMMRGYKWRLFCLQLSFIGWAFVVAIIVSISGVLGAMFSNVISFIVGLPLAVYMNMTTIHFYSMLCGSNAEALAVPTPV